MSKKLGILIDNVLNVDFNEVFSKVINMGVSLEHIDLNHTSDSKIIVEKVKGYDYVVAGRENWDSFTLKSVGDTLKLIMRFGTGTNTVDLESATKKGIAVSNAPGKNARSVAEHALAMTLSNIRMITAYDRDMRLGSCKAVLSQSLEGTFGFFGFGNIAQHFARMLQPFDLNLIAYDLYPNYDAAKKYNVEMVSQEDVVSESNFISLHLPLTKETTHIICKENIDKMKDGVYIVNTCRGGVIKEDDLINALKTGKIAGASLDVFENEPYRKESELSSMKNVILTPHAAAVSTQGVRDVLEFCAQTILNFHKGKEVSTIVNPEYKNYIKS